MGFEENPSSNGFFKVESIIKCFLFCLSSKVHLKNSEITCSLKLGIWETMQAIVTQMQLENAGLLQFGGNVGHFNPVTNHQPIFRSCKAREKTNVLKNDPAEKAEVKRKAWRTHKKVPSSPAFAGRAVNSSTLSSLGAWFVRPVFRKPKGIEELLNFNGSLFFAYLRLNTGIGD